MWNDHWSIMKPAYFIIWFSFNINFRFSINDVPGPKSLYSANMWSTQVQYGNSTTKWPLYTFSSKFPSNIYSILFDLPTLQTSWYLKISHKARVFSRKIILSPPPSWKSCFPAEVIYACAERNFFLRLLCAQLGVKIICRGK